MKIAIVTGDDIIADSRDAVDECAQLCAALAAHGHDVTAYERRRDERRQEVVTKREYRTVSVCAGPPAELSPPRVLPFVGDWSAELARLWAAELPEIVHTHGWLGGLAAQLAAGQRRLPTVQTFRGLAATAGPDPVSNHSERARLEPLLARNASWVTAGNSDELDALARVRRNRSRLSVLSTGVDVERFAPVGPKVRHSDLHRVLCVEPNPLPCNGFDTMIRILPRLPATELVIAETAAAGSRHDEERTRLKKLAAELGVSERIRFAGNVAADELPALLRSAEVVACAPWQSPRATTALQAMASGVVVVAEAIGALSDAVVHSVTGLLVPPNNPDELAAALKTLQAQRFLYESMGAAGRSRAVSRFTWDRIALDALNIYHQVSSQPQQQDRGTRVHRAAQRAAAG